MKELEHMIYAERIKISRWKKKKEKEKIWKPGIE